MYQRTQHIALSAMFMAMGILLPLLFHLVGAGSVFLPMFWPVAMAAYFLPVSFAVMVGMLTPVLSTLLTGMPPVSPPVLHIMTAELAVLSGMTAFLYTRTRWGVIWPLVTGLLFSRCVLAGLASLLAPMLGLPPRLVSFVSIIRGLPGILAMLIIIPLLLGRMKHEMVIRPRRDDVQTA